MVSRHGRSRPTHCLCCRGEPWDQEAAFPPTVSPCTSAESFNVSGKGNNVETNCISKMCLLWEYFCFVKSFSFLLAWNEGRKLCGGGSNRYLKGQQLQRNRWVRLEDRENRENESQGDRERDFQICMTGPVKEDLGKCAWCHL